MTKKDAIMALHREGKTTRQIAEKVYSLTANATADEWDRKMAYVRVVIRQRKGTGTSEASRRYMAARFQDPEFRAKQFAIWKHWSNTVWEPSERGKTYRRQYYQRKKLEAAATNHIA